MDTNHWDCTGGQCSNRIVASCVRFSSQSLSEDDHRGYFPQCLLPQATRHGQAFCHLSRQDTSHGATLPGQARGQARVTCASNRSQASIRVNPVKGGLTPSQDQQTTAGKVLLMGLVEYVAALLFLPGSRGAWVLTSTQVTTSLSTRRT